MDTDHPASPAGRTASSSFVVRVWTEAVAASPGEWAFDIRGSVQRVGSPSLRYFASLDAMREIIGGFIDGSCVVDAAPHVPGSAS